MIRPQQIEKECVEKLGTLINNTKSEIKFLDVEKLPKEFQINPMPESVWDFPTKDN